MYPHGEHPRPLQQGRQYLRGTSYRGIRIQFSGVQIAAAARRPMKNLAHFT
jgi:hypothetical protein